jgi:hypothetical protein
MSTGQNQGKNALDIQTTSGSFVRGMQESAYIVDIEARYTTILGSKQKVSAIRKFVEDNPKEIAFTNFARRISRTIQALSPTPTETVMIDDSHQVRKLVLHYVPSSTI